MSMIHLRQIKAHLQTTYGDKVDLSDYGTKTASECESALLSRSLAAFALQSLAEIEPEEAAMYITDGSQDNDVDAVYCHENEKTLYIVQSKWRHDGSGSIERGEAQKFIKGFRDLINVRFDRFNSKVKAMSDQIEAALSDSQTRIFLVIIYSGQEPLSQEVKRDFDDILAEMNDPTEVVRMKTLRQLNIYTAMVQGTRGTPIDIEVVLYDWGQTREPYRAYYGQVSASEVADWWDKYYPRIFTPNIRMFLGDTDVNAGILSTLRNEPEHFWYVNNGITALCAGIDKKPLGGSSRDMGVFECRDVRVVNGAQTVGSVAAAAATHSEQLGKARIPIRFISLDNCPEGFDALITRSNNTQNRIEKRDFVALDVEQERIRNELQLDGVVYVYKSGETLGRGQVGFDLSEATVARACAQEDIAHAIQAKREISKLWEDLQKPPYKLLFNPSVSGPVLWKQVQILRQIEKSLKRSSKELDGRSRMFTVHANRLIAHLVFNRLPSEMKISHVELNNSDTVHIAQLTDSTLNQLITIANELYPDAYLASLFKNPGKCKNLGQKILSKEAGAKILPKKRVRTFFPK
jgi:hypothetical protein